MTTGFLSGVVEGFYGRPWTPDQRLELFGRMKAWRLNTYFYAPKDDLKHRALWRVSYDATELAVLQGLINHCQQHGLRFIYGLSPGLDIVFTSEADRLAIEQRFSQLMDLGVRDFALLFDDLPGDMSEADQRAYRSVAAAQCAVTNQAFQSIHGQHPQSRLLFCPTPYCDRMDRSGLGGSGYLETIGEQLDPFIDVLWTGPEIISREIPVESIRALTARIQRRPVIWDNLHANDYDGRRLFCGPYSGRSIELKEHVAGIVTNPNNDFPINFVPLRTLSMFLSETTTWNPRAAYESALSEWHTHFATVSEIISLDDLVLLADCFYLPHELGPKGEHLCRLVERLLTQPVQQWNGADLEFARLNAQVQHLFDKLTQLRDRELFYAWSRRAWDLKEELQLIEGYIAKKQAGDATPQLDTHLPGTYRGGVVARLQAGLAMDDHGRFRSQFSATP